ELTGVDIYLDWTGEAKQLGDALSGITAGDMYLKAITNRGAMVYPGGCSETFVTDHWRCRFLSRDGEIVRKDIVLLQERLINAGYDVIKTENLYRFNNIPGFSAIQGEG